MTEEIIIDCAFYKDGVCASPINKTCEYCKNIDVSKCYNKQLKRLKQERDEWKKKYEDVANENLKEIYELIKKNDCWRGVVNVVCSKLEQENKNLKDNNNHLQVIIDEGRAENKRFREENKELKEKIKKYSAINEQETKDYAELNKDLLTERQENAELATENHNLRKALETIREILNVKCSIIANAECVGIINEVLNENN